MKTPFTFLLVLLISFGYSQYSTDSLILSLPFNGNTNDESGNENHGVNYGATLTSDRFGNENSAYDFDGIDDFIEIPDNNDIDLVKSFTIQVWINPDSISGGRNILGKQWCNYQFAYNLSIVDGKLSWAWNEWGSCTYSNGYKSDNAVIDESQSTHIVVIHNENYIKFYINGELINGSLINGEYSQIFNSNQPLRIGVYKLLSGELTSFFDGVIDDIRIWNYELSEEEVLELYSPAENNLVVYFPFNGNTNDESGNENHGINYGATLTKDRFGNENSAYDFDGIDDFIEINPIEALSSVGDFTLSVWFKFEDWTIQTEQNGYFNIQHIFCGHSYSGTTTSSFLKDGFNINVSLRNDSVEELRNSTIDIDGTIYPTIVQTSDLLDRWHHNVFIREGQQTYHYFDGVLMTENYNDGSILDVMHNIYIGTFSGNNPNYDDRNYNFNGKIDDVYILNRAISEEEVLELYSPAENYLVVYFPFNGNTNDESGNENHGVNYGATLTSDRFGNENSAYEFDGVDDFIKIVPQSDVSEIGDFTIGVWTYLNEWEIQAGIADGLYDRQYVFEGCSTSDTSTSDFLRPGFRIMYDYSDSYEELLHNSILYDSVDIMNNLLATNTPMDLSGSWHFVVWMRNGSQDYTYFDGELVNSTYSSQNNRSTLLNMQHPWFIGTFAGNNPNYNNFNYNFDGKIDDVYIYNRAISEEEVLELYNYEESSSFQISPSDTTICAGNQIILSVPDSADSYLWSTGETTSSIIVNPVVETTFEVTVVYNDEVYADQSIVHVYADVELGEDIEICQGSEAEIHAGEGFENYLWNTGSIEEYITVTAPGLYWVTTENAAGCISYDTIELVYNNNCIEFIGFQKISQTEGNFDGILNNYDGFGFCIDTIGDLNNDGITDVAVGAIHDEDGGTNCGALWILFMNEDHTVNHSQKISNDHGNFDDYIEPWARFGTDIAPLGDMDGDNVEDIIVTALEAESGGHDRGAAWVLFLNENGTVKDQQKISDIDGGFTGFLEDYDYFGSSVTNLGDLDGDGITDVAIGAKQDDDGGTDRGALWILFLNDNGTVKSHQKISNTAGNFNGDLDNNDLFGNEVCVLNDINGDGIVELAVGSRLDDDGAYDTGAVWILFISEDGNVITYNKISQTSGNFNGEIISEASFGTSVVCLGDINNDDIPDICVGAYADDDGNEGSGAFWIIFLDENGNCTYEKKISNNHTLFNGSLDENDWLGISAGIIDKNESILTFGVGAYGDDDGGADRGAIYIFTLPIEPIPFQITPSDTTICAGNQIILSVPDSADSYLWSTGETTPFITVNPIVETIYEVAIVYNGEFFTDQSIVHIYPDVDLGEDIEICQGSEIEIHAGQGFVNYLWNTGSNNEFIFVIDAGTYWVSVENNAGCISLDSIIVNVNLTPYVNLGNDTIVCEEIILTLDAGTEAEGYYWNTGETTQTIEASEPGIYWVSASIGDCYTVDSISIMWEEFNLPLPEICMVSIDSASQNCIAIWDKLDNENILTVNIYKEFSVNGVFELIGNVPYQEENSYLDTLSEAGVHSEKYKISYIDICGNETDLSEHHKTIHLSANSGTSGENQLTWANEGYEGFDFGTYYIYRWKNDEPEIIDSVSSSVSSYTDFDPPHGFVYYMLAAKRESPCYLMNQQKNSQSIFLANSNIQNNGFIGINDIGNQPAFIIHPNPNSGCFAIKSDHFKQGYVCVKIISQLGKELSLKENISILSGEIVIDAGSLSPGVYFLIITQNEKNYSKKIIIY